MRHGGGQGIDRASPRVGFVMEQTLGHVTHADNLRRLLPAAATIDARFADVPYEIDGWAARVPLFGTNWTVRAGVRARRVADRLLREDHVEALFVHTQVPAVLLGRRLTAVPTIISIDATPIQYDELGDHYAHERSSERVERVKWRLQRRAFARATHIVSWSDWGKRSLVADYGVSAAKVTVIPPGVDVERWSRRHVRAFDGTVRILFVGGDLARKGGHELIEAFAEVRRRIAATNPDRSVELHLVTNAPVDRADGVFVHPGLTPNSVDLIAQYHRSDIFCLPTRGDCLPMVLSEAGAAELALVSTDVGAISEIVQHGTTGLLVTPGDVGGLADALHGLVVDDDRRRDLARRAREHVVDRFDAAKNAARLATMLGRFATESTAGRRRALVTVSGVIPEDLDRRIADGDRPRADYRELARALDADVIDYAAARTDGGRLARLAAWAGSDDLALAFACLRRRSNCSVLLTDGEQVGLPYALLSRLISRRRLPSHTMVVHILSVPKKAWLFRAFRLGRRIDRMIVYATTQRRFAIDVLRMPAAAVHLSPFMVDTSFFQPSDRAAAPERLVVSAGLEFRDYDTLLEAVRGLNAQVVIAAASPWSKRSSSVDGRPLPDNVRITKLGLAELRELYSRAAVVVMPLHDVEFQAGITTILEAMSMSRALIVTRTQGQTDVIIDGVNGIYVPPADPSALRAEITRLLDDPAAARRLGDQARRWVVEHAEVAAYADRIAAIAEGVAMGSASSIVE